MSVGSFAPALEIVEGAKPMQGHTNIARFAVKRLSETVSVWRRIACAKFGIPTSATPQREL